MTESRQYKQRAVFIKYQVDLVGTKQDKKISIKYTRPDTETPTAELTVGAFENQLDDSTKGLLKSLKPGDETCVTKEQNGKFWKLVSVTDVSNAPVRTSKESYTSNNKSNPGGQTIGMSIKAAVDLSIANKKYTVAEVGEVARNIMRLSAAIESEYNRGEFKVEKVTEEVYTPTPSIQNDSTLENLDF